MATYKLTGNTYPYRSKLTDAGAKWDATAKCWITGSQELVDRIQSKSYYGPRMARDIQISAVEAK